MFKLIKTEGKARRGVFETVHGTVQSPFFMNVATCGAIKGGISSIDLKDLKLIDEKQFYILKEKIQSFY